MCQRVLHLGVNLSPVLLVPTVDPSPRVVAKATRLVSLTDRTVVFVDNRKAMADVFLQELAKTLQRSFGIVPIHLRTPGKGIRVAPVEFLEDVAKRADAVVFGVGD